MHMCDNRRCIRPDHLAAGTLTLNNNDRHAKGRSGDHRGENNGQAVQTWDTVEQIRTEYKAGAKQIDLAVKYGCTQAAISKIILEKTWKRQMSPGSQEVPKKKDGKRKRRFSRSTA